MGCFLSKSINIFVGSGVIRVPELQSSAIPVLYVGVVKYEFPKTQETLSCFWKSHFTKPTRNDPTAEEKQNLGQKETSVPSYFEVLYEIRIK